MMSYLYPETQRDHHLQYHPRHRDFNKDQAELRVKLNQMLDAKTLKHLDIESRPTRLVVVCWDGHLLPKPTQLPLRILVTVRIVA